MLGIDVGAGNDIVLDGGIQAGKTADFPTCPLPVVI